jgi:thiol-disulfide isomerase/thioredoxin
MPARTLRRLCVAGAVALALSTAACAGTGGDTPDTRYVAGDSAVTVVPADKRGEPVELAGSTLAGYSLDVATLRGKPVVLNVWASDCAPCRKEAPQLQAAYDTLGGEVAFVGINTREPDPAQARAFERRFGITYPSLVDDGGELLLNLRGAVSPSAIPTTLVLDESGRVGARVNGPTTTATLVGLVEDVRGSPGRVAG